jgi:predicted ATPase
MTLSRLGRSQVEVMVARVTGGKALPPEVVQQIVAKTDGVPLFVEELTKTVVESGLLTAVNDHYELSGPLPPLAIPSTLHASLLARLDRLSTVREIAQLGATIGREFSYELIHAVSPLDEGRLQQGLKQLVEAELVYQRGLVPQAHYLFKHALIQDTAYQSLLKSTRQQSHRQIAQVLEGRFTEIVETQPELVAQHYTEAGLIGQALPYWQKAGERANQRSAYVEAINHLTKGLELLKTLPDTSERAQQELMLQIVLGTAHMATQGHAAPEVERVYARARELCQQVGEAPQLFSVLAGLSIFYKNRAEYKTAIELAEQYLRLAQSVEDSYRVVIAHCLIAEPLRLLGESALARVHLEQGIALYDPQQHRSLIFRSVVDPGTHSLSQVAYALWSLGYPDQALKRSQKALTLAQEISHPHSLTWVLLQAAGLRLLRREEQAGREQAERAIALSIEYGFPACLALGTIQLGRALAEQGQGEDGIAQIRQGLTAWRAIGTEIGRSYWLASLAEAYGKVGQVEEGLTVLAEALAHVYKTGERVSEAELYRIKGELVLQSAVHSRQSEVKTSLGQVSDKSKTSHEQVQDKSQTSLEQVRTSQDKSAVSDPQAEAEAEAMKQ